MIKYYIKESGILKQIDTLKPSCWAFIAPPFELNELETLAEEQSIPLDFLTDPLDINEKSRYEREENVRLIIFNTPLLNETEKETDAIYVTVPIGIVLTADNIFTITNFDNPVLEKFLASKVKNFDPADEKMFVLKLFEQTVYRFLECLKKLNLKKNLIEQELYNSSRNEELQQLLRIEKSLVYFVNSLSDNDLLKMKIKRTDFLQIRDLEDHSDLFEDIIIDCNQATEMSNVYTNILGSTMEAYASIISNNLNVFIQRLTVVTIILMVPTLVASFYGMNLKSLPFQDHPGAFYLLLLGSVILGLLLIWFFRRKKLF
jgi:magnesium transporter